MKLAFTLLVINRWPEEMNTAEQIKQWWKEIGVDLAVQQLDAGGILAQTAVNQEDMYLWGFSGSPDPTFSLNIMLERQIGNWNGSGYINPEYDKLFDLQKATVDQAERQKIVNQMQEIIYEDALCAVLYYMNAIRGLSIGQIHRFCGNAHRNNERSEPLQSANGPSGPISGTCTRGELHPPLVHIVESNTGTSYMRKYFLNRLVQSLVLLFIILTVNFILFRVMPGDPVKLLFYDPRITVEQQQVLRGLFGLDKPLAIQYGLYMVNTLRGDFGMSFFYHQPAGPIIFERLRNTLILLFPSVCLAALIGGILGSISAWKRGTKLDTVIYGSSLVFWSTPLFWLGLAMILLFIGVLPISGMKTAGAVYPNMFAQMKDLLSHMALPLIAETVVLQAPVH